MGVFSAIHGNPWFGNRRSAYTLSKHRLRVRQEDALPVYNEELRRITFNAACNQALDRSLREGVQCIVYERPGAPATFYVRLVTESAPEGTQEAYRTIDRRDPYAMHADSNPATGGLP